MHIAHLYFTQNIRKEKLDWNRTGLYNNLPPKVNPAKPTLEALESLRWRQNGRDSVSDHQPHDCLLNRLFRRRSKKTSKLRVTGLCAGKSPGTGDFPAQMASNAENVSIQDSRFKIQDSRSLYCNCHT